MGYTLTPDGLKPNSTLVSVVQDFLVPTWLMVLEIDTSINGLAALLQVQSDCKLHPIAYTSQSLSPSEENYSVTELETLTVVWAMSHFH